MKMFNFKLIEEAEEAGAVPGPNRAERRFRERESRRAQRRGQRAYERAIIEAEKARTEEDRISFEKAALLAKMEAGVAPEDL